ncbi:hypothetical protein SAMN05519104_8051 [Rhizobiales bacterium GAS188]|nr:hypothetical protein SAMN05519104_8051 [Rhizobiales bacterium GAS188]
MIAKRLPMFKASKEIREVLNPNGVKASRTRKTSFSERGIEAEGPGGE